jgi:hypothetical protein
VVLTDVRNRKLRITTSAKRNAGFGLILELRTTMKLIRKANEVFQSPALRLA